MQRLPGNSQCQSWSLGAPGVGATCLARLPRSYLFVPADRLDRLDKALASGADAVIVDLEDAVSPDVKIAARTLVASWLTPAREVYIRINGAGTEWFKQDVAHFANHAGVAGIVLPKAESAEQIVTVLETAHDRLVVLPIIETAQGFWNLVELCRAPRVSRVMFGSLDFQIDLGLADDPEVLLAYRSQLVLVSRVAGIGAPVDGVTTTLDDDGATFADAKRAQRMGFRGKLCIHPKQIDSVHRAFSHTRAERAWAQRVLDTVAANGGAAVSIDGKMVDLPMILKAREIAGSFDA